MKGINYVCLSGYLGSDPELRHTATGKAVTELRLATPRRIRHNGEAVEETEWNTITLWEQRAEYAASHLRRGDPVVIQGRLRTERWTTSNGDERKTKVIVAHDVTALPSRRSLTEDAPAEAQAEAS